MESVRRVRYELLDPPIKVAGQFGAIVEITEVFGLGDKDTEVLMSQALKVLWGATKETLVAQIAGEKAALVAVTANRQQALDERIALVEAAPTTEKDAVIK